MITTRESINYQFSLIFGYSSPKEITVGDVISPGKLTKEKLNELSEFVIKFLRMYNAILRDYAGSEVFSIEFELFNYDENDAKIKIYPKSMILIPGRYKECESLLLALKPDTGYLNPHKSGETVNNISKLFYEIEEFTDHPELGLDGKKKVLSLFANRFSKKLYGDLIEDKWNKKLIGISISLPTEKEMLNSYASIKSDVKYLWNKRPIEVSFNNSKYVKVQTPFDGQASIEHLKYIISEPSANFIVNKTLKLGTDLIKLANNSSIDETQEKIVQFIIRKVKEKVETVNELQSATWLISYSKEILENLEKQFNLFVQYSSDFTSSGEIGNIDDILEKYKNNIYHNTISENLIFNEIYDIAEFSINQSISEKKSLRAVELSSVIKYFSELTKNCFNIIRDSLPRFLSFRRMKILTYNLLKSLLEKFEMEQKPSKVLGRTILNKFREFIINQIEISPLLLLKKVRFSDEILIKEFKKIVKGNLDSFFNEIQLNISDLIGFIEVQLEKDSKLIKSHLDNFEKFSNELDFLLSYILRYSTINRFLKEEPGVEISDPVSFANKFHRFLEKRIGGIDLVWKSYILEWIKDYAKKFFNIEEKRDWVLNETFSDFLNYIEERESLEQIPENFLKFLDNYIGKVSDGFERDALLDFCRKFEQSIDIKTEFPKYVKNKIEKEMNILSLESETLYPINFFSINEEESFYNYIIETDLKYFSKLIPRPISLILKHELTSDEKELFKGDLFHILNFKYWHNKSKYDVLDNFEEVYREWLKEIL
ncbi:MAG: hypothetical protein ACFE85_09545 [Candidatus Hodarchaeota archaeon]